MDNLESESGMVYGIDVMFNSESIHGSTLVGGLLYRDFTDLPEDFMLYPQSVPNGIKINVDKAAEKVMFESLLGNEMTPNRNKFIYGDSSIKSFSALRKRLNRTMFSGV